MSALSVAEVLDRAADLIEPEGKWTQKEFARDVNGKPLSLGYDERAACWCIVGALEKALGRKEAISHLAPYWDAVEELLEENLTGWNDANGRTQPEVVAKLREAAALAREQGK